MSESKTFDKSNNSEFRDNIYILKAFAIFSVICAHSCSVSADSGVWNIFVSDVLTSIGTVGVFIFYFLSGTRKSVKEFWKQKLFSVIVPWLFCGTIVYLYVYLRGEGISFLSWVKWILGMDTYLYYIVVLLVFYVLFYWLRKNKTCILIFTILSIAYNILLFAIPQEVFSIRYPYLDPLRFGYMFSLGLLIANMGIFPELMYRCKKYVVYMGILSAASILIPALFEYNYTYFVPWFVIFAVVAFLFALGLSQSVSGFVRPFLKNAGQWSYAFYLIHMPIAGVIVYLCKHADFAPVTLLRPFIVYGIVYLSVMIIKKIKVFKFVEFLIGIR